VYAFRGGQEVRTRHFLIKWDKGELCNAEVNQNQFLLDWPGVPNDFLKLQAPLSIPEMIFWDSWPPFT